MKNKLTILVIAIAASALAFTACQTQTPATGSGTAITSTNAAGGVTTNAATTPASTPASNPALTAAEEVIITSTVQDATFLVLNKNPQYKPDFVVGEQVIQALATGTNTISAAAVDAALTASGETNQVVNMVILNGVTAINAYAKANSGSDPTIQNQQILTGLDWVYTGIASATGE